MVYLVLFNISQDVFYYNFNKCIIFLTFAVLSFYQYFIRESEKRVGKSYMHAVETECCNIKQQLNFQVDFAVDCRHPSWQISKLKCMMSYSSIIMSHTMYWSNNIFHMTLIHNNVTFFFIWVSREEWILPVFFFFADIHKYVLTFLFSNHNDSSLFFM